MVHWVDSTIPEKWVKENWLLCINIHFHFMVLILPLLTDLNSKHYIFPLFILSWIPLLVPYIIAPRQQTDKDHLLHHQRLAFYLRLVLMSYFLQSFFKLHFTVLQDFMCNFRYDLYFCVLTEPVCLWCCRQQDFHYTSVLIHMTRNSTWRDLTSLLPLFLSPIIH